MDDVDRKFELTSRDLMAGYDESKLDRVGKPLGVERHDFDKPESADTTQHKASHTLMDMAKDYEFFTTGVIHAATIFDRDPVAEFNRVFEPEGPDELPQAIDHRTTPFFQGLGVCLVAGLPVNLDHRLYAILRHRWEKLRNFIAGIAMSHRETGFYARLSFYELRLVDPFALRKMSVVTKVPTVPVTVFGVSSNKSFSYLQPVDYPRVPYLVAEDPKPDVKAEGAAVLGPPPSPEHLLRPT